MTCAKLAHALRLCNQNLLPGELRVEGQGLTERCGDRKIGLAIMFLSVIFLSACTSNLAEGCSRSSRVDYARFVVAGSERILSRVQHRPAMQAGRFGQHTLPLARFSSVKEAGMLAMVAADGSRRILPQSKKSAPTDVGRLRFA